MHDILIDCDPGMDDAVAIMLALKSPGVRVHAITCATGNLLAQRCAENASKILDVLDAPPIPVAVGPAQPMVRAHAVDPFSHGADGLAETNLPLSSRPTDPRFAPDVIIETVDALPHSLTVIALAPLTNLALAMIKAPGIAERISQIYFIGGNYGFHECGQLFGTGTTPLSEWNVLVDPEAARIVFRSGVPLVAMGVDIWARPEMNLTDAELDLLRDSSKPEANLVARFVDFVQRRGYSRYSALIDALAVAVALDPTLVSTHEVGIDVETVSPLTLGMTVVERRVHHAWSELPRIRAAYDADFDRYREALVSALIS
jgi:inosine-uridine nucleoside N-ribohydrolase